MITSAKQYWYKKLLVEECREKKQHLK